MSFVDVPNVPGVPLVNFAADIVLPALLTADAAGLFQGVIGPVWGIFSSDSGFPVVVADSVVSLEYKQEYTVSDFPLEQGAFESYDKVQVPFDVRLRFATGGGPADRQALLASIQAIVGDLNLYDAVTPEAVYPSCNVVHQDYRRTSVNGVGLLQVDVWLQEVRVSATTSTSSVPSSNLQPGNVSFMPADPAAANPAVGGTVQPTAPTPAYVNAAGSIVGATPVGPPQGFPGQP